MTCAVLFGLAACGERPPTKARLPGDASIDAGGTRDAETPGPDAGRDPCARCAPEAICDPAAGTCTCIGGYADTAGDGTACADVDECATGTADCAPDASCTNAVGTFSCACLPGFVGDGRTCFAAVDCSADPAACGAGATCERVDGFDVCVCGAGLVGDGRTCAEVDGCATTPCFSGVSCTDVPAPGTGYVCGTCPEGTAGDGELCVDIDGCAAEPCYEGVVCTDITAPGSGYSCGACPSGFEGDGVTCVDVDGCAADPCFPGVACADVPAPGVGFVCDACPDGFVGDGVDCVDDCAGRTCGPSPVLGRDCGACSGATEVCSAAGQCMDDCAGRVCGPSPVAGYDCGSCAGGAVYCSATGRCVDDCQGRQCGPSPVLGVDCGTCNDPATCEAGVCEYPGCFGSLCWHTTTTGGTLDAMELHCASSTRDGFTNWRLPTITELKSLIQGCSSRNCPVSPTCSSTTPPCWTFASCAGCSLGGGPGVDGCYWDPELGSCGSTPFYSSTPVNTGLPFVWSVDFAGGGVGYVNGTYIALARCVRPR